MARLSRDYSCPGGTADGCWDSWALKCVSCATGKPTLKDTRTARASRIVKAYNTPLSGLGSGCTVKCDLLHAFNKSRRNACKSECAARDAQAQAAQAAADAAAQAALAQAAQTAANALLNQQQQQPPIYTDRVPGKFELTGELIGGVPNYVTYPVAGFLVYKLVKKKKGKK